MFISETIYNSCFDSPGLCKGSEYCHHYRWLFAPRILKCVFSGVTNSFQNIKVIMILFRDEHILLWADFSGVVRYMLRFQIVPVCSLSEK